MKTSQERVLNIVRLALKDALIRTLLELVSARGSAALAEVQSKLVSATRDFVAEAIVMEDIAREDEAEIIDRVIEDLSFVLEETVKRSASLHNQRGTLPVTSPSVEAGGGRQP